ncbi:hypothetical protein F2P79_009158 [Pimephales promelas]|nr:hypothetical protein F2P79_009158 [Pimephales promelas]
MLLNGPTTQFHAPRDITSPRLVLPRCRKGDMPVYAQSRTMWAAHRSTRTSRHPQRHQTDAAVVVFLCLQPTRGQLLSTASPPGPTSGSIWSTATQTELNGLPRRCCQYAVKHRPVLQPNKLKFHSQKNDFAKIHQAAFAPRPELPCCNRASVKSQPGRNPRFHPDSRTGIMNDDRRVQSWTAADSALGTSTVINHTLTIDIHAAQEARKCKPPQPPRDPQEEGTTLETASNLSKLSPYLSLAAACHLTLMIHLPSVHCDGVVR